jgi:hypothetical protein
MVMTEKPLLNDVSRIAGGKSVAADGLTLVPAAKVPAAERALAEAQGRRAEADRESNEQPKELHGRKGPDPVRYGDWEVKGIASDF